MWLILGRGYADGIPVTYVMEGARSLILEGFDGAALAKGFAVILVAMALMLGMSVRMVNSYG